MAGSMIGDQDDGRRQIEEENQRLTVKAELFYTDDGMVASTDPGWIQSEFYALTGIFDWVRLRTNFRKTVGMVCRPCWESGVRADEAYTRHMTGEGRSSKEWQREQVLCP